MTRIDPLRRLIYLGRDARYPRLETDLDYPPKSILRRYVIVIPDDGDMYRMYGYQSDELRILPANPTANMWDFVRGRGHECISFEEAKQWLKSKTN